MRSLWILVVAVGWGPLCSGSSGKTPWDTLSPTTTPRIFFPGTVSRRGIVHFNNSASDDGRLLAYTITGKDVPGYIVTQRWTGTAFQPPVRLPLDPEAVHSDPHLTPGGQRILFASTLGGGEGGFRLWQVTRDGEGWSIPRPVAIADEPAGSKGYPSLTADGTLYFSSMPEGTRNSDIYRAEPAGAGFAAPERLPAPVSSDRFEGDPFIDRRERFLVFAAFDRAEGLGESDLFVSFRCDGGWTEPTHLGPEINSVGFDGSPWVTPDDRFLIFTSSRPTDASGEQDFFNVYYVSIDPSALAPECARE
ncbi:MAG: hypothetical protein LJF30_25265 [Acidobacteria bacterium]|nr:hypothetical protein [Acidobacteriota bacterium]